MTQKKFGGIGGLKGLLDETKQTAKHNCNFPKIIRKITLKVTETMAQANKFLMQLGRKSDDRKENKKQNAGEITS